MSDDGTREPEPGGDPVPQSGWLIASLVVAMIVIVGAIAVIIAMTQWSGDTTGPDRPLSTPSEFPPSGTTTPAPADDGQRALPTDCRSIYSPAFLENHAYMPLNDPRVVETDVSRFVGVEAIRETLPGIECHWGPPTEGGLTTAVNEVTPAQQDEAIILIKSHGVRCGDWNQGVLCHYSTGPDPKDPNGWVIAEQHFFRDGLWVTTWWASTFGSIEEDALAVYTTLWP